MFLLELLVGLAVAAAAALPTDGTGDVATLSTALASDDECAPPAASAAGAAAGPAPRDTASCGLSALQLSAGTPRNHTEALASAAAGAAAERRAGGSCAAYGCGGFARGRSCQCNRHCGRDRDCCWDHFLMCESPVWTVYHQTGPDIGPLILRNGFRLGSQGWCGGAIYFAMTPEATITKAIGADSHVGYLIQAKVRVGNVQNMPAMCDNTMTGHQLHSQGFDTILFNPGDGPEAVIYRSSQVVWMAHVPMPMVAQDILPDDKKNVTQSANASSEALH